MALGWLLKHPNPLVRTAARVAGGELSVLAAGIALFGLLGTVPTLAAIVSIYSLVANPSDIEPQLASLAGVLPREVVAFLIDQLEREAARPQGQVGIALATSLFLALWSARAAVSAAIDALHHAYRVPEDRGFTHRVALRFGMALGGLVGLLVTAVVVVALPAVVALLGATINTIDWVAVMRWPVLLVVYNGAMMALYHLAPSPRDVARHRVLPGAVAATSLWLFGSFGLSVYVSRIANYENVYGAFGGVVVVILWFYISAISIVLGGVLNAELERTAALAGE